MDSGDLGGVFHACFVVTGSVSTRCLKTAEKKKKKKREKEGKVFFFELA